MEKGLILDEKRRNSQKINQDLSSKKEKTETGDEEYL